MSETDVQELLAFFDNNSASSSLSDKCKDPDFESTEDVPIPTYELDFKDAYLTQESSLFSNIVDMNSKSRA